MNRSRSTGMLLALLLGAGLLVLSGCPSKDSSEGQSGAGKSSGSGSASNQNAASNAIVGEGDGDAVKAVSEELAKHWLKTADGWSSEYPAKTYLATGQRAGPESFYRQLKQLKFGVDAEEISESDKLNGIQFRALCQFASTPKRIYGDPNAFGPPRWSDWQSSDESLRVEKRNGKWIFGSGDFLLSGTKPSESTVGQLK